MTLYMYLQAGLGNQLFMIFALISYAIDHGLKDYKILSYPTRTMNGTQTYWDSILGGFKEMVMSNVLKTQNPDENPIIQNVEYEKYEEPQFAYEQLPHELAYKNVMLKGFFQSYKYFEHNFNKIKEIMQWEQKLAEVKDELLPFVQKKTIAMHFRIGDYIGLQAYHCIKGPEYYIHTLKILERDLEKRGENIDDYTILFFCQQHDDEYIAKYLKVIELATKKQYNFVRVPEELADWKQMMLMSLCQHFIIANSTFSWFGAYFSQNPDKLVYYPKKWFGPALANKHDTKDLCPKEWIQVDV